MKRFQPSILALGASGLLLLLNGCSASSQDSPPVIPFPSKEAATIAPAPQPPPANPPVFAPWKYRYVTVCANAVAEKCPGAYGFSVASDGTYEVGPGPQGQVIGGHLDRGDLQAISGVVSSARAGECGSDWATKPCAPVDESMKKLLAKYYPDTFPNPCVDAALELERAYAGVSRCESDSDCAYLDDDFLPISSDRPGDITRDDCSYVKPLLAANALDAVAHQLPLVLKRAAARQVCRDTPHRPTCTRPDSADPLRHPPVCVNRSCRAGFDLSVI